MLSVAHRHSAASHSSVVFNGFTAPFPMVNLSELPTG